MFKPGLFLVALVAAILLFSVNANAQTSQIKSWYTLPTGLSADQPFIFVVETQAQQNGNRLSWQKILSPTAFGSFNRLSSTLSTCYFASDTTATCGPTPFIQESGQKTGTFDGFIRLNGPSLNESANFQINISTVKVNTFKAVNGPTIDASATVDGFPGNANVIYKLFDSVTLNLIKNGNTSYRSGSGDYYVNLTLNSGKYYLVFDVLTPTLQKGGSVIYFEIGGGSSILPTIQSGIDVAISAIEANTVAGDTVDRQFVINNPTNTTYSNLSIVVPDKIKQYVTIELLSKTLQMGNSTEYTIKVRADNSIVIKDSFDLVETRDGVPIVLKTVPLDIKVSVTGASVQSIGDKPVLDIDPLVITGLDMMTGNTSTQKLSVRNLGVGNLTLETAEIEGFEQGVVTVNQPAAVSSTPGEITISIKPTNVGDYRGRVKIKSNGGVKLVYIDFSAFDDISKDFEAFRNDFTSYKANLTKKGVSNSDADKFLSSVASNLDKAESDYDNGAFSSASKAFGQAQSEFNLVKSILSSSSAPATKPPQTTQEGGGFPIWIIGVIAAVVVVLVLLIIIKKKRKGKTAEDEYEEEETTEEDEEYQS